MNEHIDLLLASAEVASSSNPWASLATHSVAATYHTSMIGQCRYQLAIARNLQMPEEVRREYNAELTKHCILGGIAFVSLFLTVISPCDKTRQNGLHIG